MNYIKKVQSKYVLELGAGTGFVGIAASLLGAEQVILTDLEYTMELMSKNISLNQSPRCKLSNQVCDWFNAPSISQFQFDTVYPDVILVADCVWIAELVDPLMKTLDMYCNDDTLVIITYQQRGKVTHEEFWYQLKQLFGNIKLIDTESIHGLSKPSSLSLIECKRVS